MNAINRRSKVPLYVQIRDELYHAIKTGQYTAETGPLPSEAALSAEHAVSRLTVRKAVRLLAAEGLVEVVPGRGAYVSGRAA